MSRSCEAQDQKLTFLLKTFALVCIVFKYEDYSFNNEGVITDLKFDLES